MKLFIFLIALSLIPGTVLAQDTQVDFGISAADGELQSFYLAVSNHYRVPGEEVVSVKERYRFRNEELPVVFYLASRARVKPSAIIDLRMSHMSWLDISLRFGLTPEIFFVPLTVKKVGPPYGKAYGNFKKYRPKKEWKKIVLSDYEVIDLVNLRFMSEHYQLKPEVVMEMRSRGKNFVTINEESAKGKQAKDTKNKAGKKKAKRKIKTR